MAAAAVPIGASLLAPELAAVAAPLVGSAMAPWLTGAALGGLGNYITGGDPLKGALFGGLGGGLTSKFMPNGLGGLFDSSQTGATDLASAGATSATNASGIGGDTLGGAVSSPISMAGQAGEGNLYNTAMLGANTANGAGASSSLLGGIGKFAPYGALSLGAMALDNAMAPKQLGPTPQSHPSNPGSVNPLTRKMQTVDPNVFFSTGGNRSYFEPYSLQTQFTPTFACGGRVRGYADGGSSEKDSQRRQHREDAMMRHAKMDGDDTADFVFNRYMDSKYPGSISQYAQDEYGDVPITRKIKSYANGGSSSASSSNIPKMGRYVKGIGDGRSDSINAKLSDGEFVMSAPVVSALGRGSNEAGARKLDQMQKDVLHKNYKGGKPPKQFGLGGYVC